jgi:hypothetical protein
MQSATNACGNAPAAIGAGCYRVQGNVSDEGRLMSAYWKSLLVITVTTLFAGCGTTPTVVEGGPGSEDAAIAMEASKREYENCVRNEAPGQPTCEGLKALYKRDLKVYEDSLKSGGSP